MKNECDCCKNGIEAFNKKEEECLRTIGWYTHYVSNDKECPYGINFHSHGFGYQFHPDVQICVPAPPKTLHGLMNVVYAEIKKGIKFLPGQKYSTILAADFDVTFIRIDNDLLRMILPDTKNNLDENVIDSQYKDQYKIWDHSKKKLI